MQLEVSRQDLENHVKRIDDIQTNYKFNNEGFNAPANDGHFTSKTKDLNSSFSDSLENEVTEGETDSESELINSPQTGAGSSSDLLQADQLQLAKLLAAQQQTHPSSASSKVPISSSVTRPNEKSNPNGVHSLGQLIQHMKSNPIYQYQCWCKAYGQHQTISSRKANIQISCEFFNLYDINFFLNFFL